jgi:nicotinate-nucleotide adenylyltransferase
VFIGLLGGTFDPVHNGHVAMAEMALRVFRLDRVYFVTSVNPPHKSLRNRANFLDRHAMVALALAQKPQMVPSSLEFGRSGKSYSIDTVRDFKNQFGKESRIFFLIGMDAFVEIPTWKDYSLLLDYCSFIVFERPGFSESHLAERLPASFAGRISCVSESGWQMETDQNRVFVVKGFSDDISSTGIREGVRLGRYWQGMVPPAVAEYIRKTQLYST